MIRTGNCHKSVLYGFYESMAVRLFGIERLINFQGEIGMTDLLSKNLSRRTLLKGGAALGAIAMIGFDGAFGFSRVLGQAMKDDDLQTIINLAATAELFATTHYLAAINGKLGLAEKQVNYLKAGFLAEQDHLELLMSLGDDGLRTQTHQQFPVILLGE